MAEEEKKIEELVKIDSIEDLPKEIKTKDGIVKVVTIEKGVGRPTVFTQTVLDKLEEAFLWGCSDKEACFYAGISPSTLYKYQEENPEYVERKELLKENIAIMSRKAIASDISGGDSKLAMDYLQRKKKDEFSIKQEMDHTSKGEQIGVVDDTIFAKALEIYGANRKTKAGDSEESI